MGTYVALLRGVNLGRQRKLPMPEFRDLLARLGLTDVRTYIQSGNAVFRSTETDRAALSRRIADAIEETRGFRTPVIVLTRGALRNAAATNPYAGRDPKRVHLFFLSGPAPAPDRAAMDAAKVESEEYVLRGEVLYLHTPDGLGRSRLAGRVERALGVPATARNGRSVAAILALAEELG